MRFKLLSAALALLMTQSALAAKPSQPPTCPTVDALKVVGVQTTSYDGPGPDRVLGVTLKNTYGTADEWTFVIGYFRDDVKSNVLEKANAAVATLELTQGPVVSPDHYWVCRYESTDPNIQAGAVTPAIDISTSKLASMMLRK